LFFCRIDSERLHTSLTSSFAGSFAGSFLGGEQSPSGRWLSADQSQMAFDIDAAVNEEQLAQLRRTTGQVRDIKDMLSELGVKVDLRPHPRLCLVTVWHV